MKKYDNWVEGLKHWREVRGLTEPQDAIQNDGKPGIVNMIQEELNELEEAILSNDEELIVDSLADIIVLSSNHLGQMSYDLNCVMNTVVTYLNQRKQDPEQEKRWKAGEKIEGEKWMKDKSKQLPEPEYNKCKL